MAPSFLDLPGEIRNCVYGLVAEHDGKVKNIKHRSELNRRICIHDYGYPMRVKLDARRALEAEPRYNYAGLTRVCRQIREEYLPLCVAHQTSDLAMCVGYDDLVDLPAILLDKNAYGKTAKELTIRVRTTDKTLNSAVDLLPVIRAKAHSLRCELQKFEYMEDEFFLGYLLLQRILYHKNEDWLAVIREPAFFDAILFNRSSRHIKIMLGQKGAAWVDAENQRQVCNLLESMEISKERGKSMVSHIENAMVSVTQSPSLQDH
ncbi:hypothetical protein P171DRAFT_431037 [Karstenula rhodostoma CBS 690.94]|uniref:Uncharacterized protein n=1 Tax=Karstenula rhodostoma CBS 690.94 TaxID=1392251 RepID=A0A9P4PMQ6_9PLEO|nr:hypothetical protein P171DRAFT_431037 [Karstenula rhodostoma CBS 690.94]